MRRRDSQGFLSIDEIASHLPAYLQDFARFAYHSGSRRGEIRGLTWKMVDRAAGTVTLPDSKNSHSRVLPLEGELGEIIKRRESVRVFTRGDQVIVSDMVFYRDGKQGIRRVGDFRKAWATACKEARLAVKPLFHDLRRSAVRTMINAEVHESRAMAITRHRTRSVFDRYPIVSLDDMPAALARMRESLR